MLIVTLDGFTPAALSCFGSSWNRTPAIDAMAMGGTTWDRTVCHQLDPSIRFTDWLSKWRLSPDQVSFVTDDGSIASLDAANAFSEIVLIDEPIESVAATMEETRLAQLFAVAMASADTSNCVWIHSRFLLEAWDAPRTLFAIETFHDLDDAEPGFVDEDQESGVSTADADWQPMPPWFDEMTPPQLAIDEHSHPDLLATWMRTYGCQIRLVDELIGVASRWAQGERGDVVVLAGGRGFALGQKGFIGGQSAEGSSLLSVPVIASVGTGLRVPHLTGLDSFPSILDLAARFDGSLTGSNADVAMAQRFPSLDEHPTSDGPESWAEPTTDAPWVLAMEGLTPVGLHTPEWFFQPGADALYLKPDDVHDINNVARLRPEEVSRFRDYCNQFVTDGHEASDRGDEG
ncbi:MAG: hypothetical protein AAGJ40_00120 [Planctomycetota bacterium]